MTKIRKSIYSSPLSPQHFRKFNKPARGGNGNSGPTGTGLSDRPERGFRTDRNGASGPAGTGLPDRPEPSQGTPKSRHLQ